MQAEVFGYDDVEIEIIDKHLHNLEKHNYQAIARDLKIAARGGLRGGQGDPEAREPSRRATSPRPTTRPSPSRPTSTSSRTARSSSSSTTTAACSGSTSTRRSPSSCCKDPNAKEFIGEKLRNAQWLIRAIEQRRKTIIRVTECIVEKQREFFEQGRRLPQADDPARRRRGGRHARVDDLARHDEQVRAHAAGALRAEVLLQLVDPPRRRRGHRLARA